MLGASALLHLGAARAPRPAEEEGRRVDKVVEVPFDRHRFLLQELVAKQLTSRKICDKPAVFAKEMAVPFPRRHRGRRGSASALLARMRRTRQGGALLPLARKKNLVELTVDQLRAGRPGHHCHLQEVWCTPGCLG